MFTAGNLIPEGENILLFPGNARAGYRRWTINEVVTDNSTLPVNRQYRCGVKWPRGQLGHLDEKRPWDFFLRLFPIAFVVVILQHTNFEFQQRRIRPLEVGSCIVILEFG
jgi:hypothetical protein